ncbi:MAG: glycosyltransferase [Fulvivirga sp.]|uniref:glycosyltransferase n=1 Tax=Fulvivirga sp. TaxID=1931237 RepID=UPI0032EF797E
MNSVTFLCHPFHRGGVTRWMVEAADEFANQGYSTSLVTVVPNGFISASGRPTMTDLLNEYKDIKVLTKSVDLTFELGIQSYRELVYYSLVVKNIPKGTPIILSDDASVWGAGKLLSKDYPIIGVLHSDDPAYYYLHNRYKTFLASVIAVSYRIKRNISDDNIKVIPCGIKMADFPIKVEESSFLKLIWVGRIEEKQKRVSDIARIGNELNNRGVKFKWSIVGHGDDTELLQMIDKFGLNKQFEFTGWLDKIEILKLMADSDILVLTSNYEGMPIVVMEGLNMGLGVVSSKVSGVEDITEHDEAHRIVRLYDIGDTESAVENIISLKVSLDSDKREEAKQIAAELYSIENCIKKYIDVFKHMKSFGNEEVSKFNTISLIINNIFSLIISKLRYLKYRVTS